MGRFRRLALRVRRNDSPALAEKFEPLLPAAAPRMHRGIGGRAVGAQRSLAAPDDGGRFAVNRQVGVQLEAAISAAKQLEAIGRMAAQHETAVAKRPIPRAGSKVDRAQSVDQLAGWKQHLERALGIDKS